MNPTTISVYEISLRNFKKGGALKKFAKPVSSISISSHLDNKDHSKDNALYAAEDIKKTIPNITSVTSPYIFTHIRLHTPERMYAVFQTVHINGTDISVSPTALFEALKS